jgi:hypothetical protein
MVLAVSGQCRASIDSIEETSTEQLERALDAAFVRLAPQPDRAAEPTR